MRTFEFRSFAEAMTFMTRIVTIGGSMQHHACWEESRHLVTVKLGTINPDKNSSSNDLKMAEAIDRMYEKS